MRAVIVYESMFGNTHAVATHIAEGMRPAFNVSVLPVHDATPEVVELADVVVVGGPTHMHGMSNTRSRRMAKGIADKDDSGLLLEPHAAGLGLRDWFKVIGPGDGRFAAAFDTRGKAPGFLTGRASKGIAHRLHRHGFHVASTKSFFVEDQGHLADGELNRARAWGDSLARVALAGRREHDATAA